MTATAATRVRSVIVPTEFDKWRDQKIIEIADEVAEIRDRSMDKDVIRDTKDVIRQELRTRMARIEALNNEARDLVEHDDFIHAADRLKKIAHQGEFDSFAMNIFAAMSSDLF